MAKLFSYDNPIWRFMGRVADVFVLTVLWTICSLPLVTIGASTSALYYVSLKMAGNQEGYLCKSFFKAFKSNFSQSTIVWFIMLIIGIILSADLYFFYMIKNQAGVFIFWLFFVLAVLCLFVFVMIFPLEARLDTSIRKLFFMAFMTCLKNFSWVMLMLVTTICIIAFSIFVFWPALLLGAGAISYIHSVILERIIFPKYGWNNECLDA